MNNELYHYGVSGMKWRVRKKRNESSGGINSNTRKTSKVSSQTKKITKNKKKSSRAPKEKDELQRTIEALELHNKAMKVSFLNTVGTAALRKTGQNSAASFLNDVGSWQVRRMDAVAGYNFWRR